jgi:hypothetical protein
VTTKSPYNPLASSNKQLIIYAAPQHQNAPPKPAYNPFPIPNVTEAPLHFDNELTLIVYEAIMIVTGFGCTVSAIFGGLVASGFRVGIVGCAAGFSRIRAGIIILAGFSW